MLGLLTFGGGEGGVKGKIESLQILDLQRLASLDHHITLLSKNESYLYET